jgi:O-antigen ligase/Tfp pilus assembly protein PilF
VLVAAVAVALLLGLPVAFRGLYFPPQQLLALIAACAVAALVWWARGPHDRTVLRDRLDTAALALAGAYLLSALTVAVHPNAAIQSFLMRLLYFLALWSAAEVVRLAPAARTVLVGGLLLGGAIVALSGVAAAGGAFAGRGFFLGHRIYTSLQYPDAAAAYVAAIAFVALGLQLTLERLWQRLLLAVAAATYLFVFVFALSRGAELVFAPVAVVFVLAQRRGRWADALAALLGPLLGVAAGALPYQRGVAAVLAHRPGGAVGVWLGLLAAWVVAAGALLAWDAWRRTRGAVRWGTVGAAALVVALGAALAVRKAGSLLARLGHLSLQDYNAWSRLRWARDALVLVARHPILGIGGGGWAAAYRSIQSYYYSSTQVHNGWLQTWVSTGSVGMLCWLAFWAFLLWAAWRAWRAAPAATRPLVVGLVAGVLMLGGHSAIDFTLSLSAVSLGLWGMAGMLRAMAEAGPAPGSVPAAAAARATAPQRRHRPHPSVPLRGRTAPRRPAAPPSVQAVGFYAAVSLLGVFALVLWVGGREITLGNAAAQAGNLTRAEADLRAAQRADPWSATAAFGLAQVAQDLAATAPSNSQAEIQDLTQAQADYQRSLALNPYGYLNAGQVHIFYGTFLEHVGDMSGALAQLRQAVADGPYVSASYDALDLGLVDEAAAAASQHQLAIGRQAVAAIGQLAAARAARAAAVPGPAKLAAAAGRVASFPPTDPAMQLAAGEAAALQGDWGQAVGDLTPLLSQPGSIGGEAGLWLSLVDGRLHRPAAAAVQAARVDLGANYASQRALVSQVVGGLAPTAPKAGAGKGRAPSAPGGGGKK